jgi:hypothetical protein
VGEDPLSHYARLFVRFLQTLFSSFEKGAYHWSLDEKATDITITDQATVNKEVVEKRPAIIISLGPLALNNISIDQFAGPLLEKNKDGSHTFTPNLDGTTGGMRHTDLISSTVTYNCLSSEGAEARRLAWMTGYFTRALKRSLMKAGLHRVGEEIQFGAESAPGSLVQPDSNEIVMVSVSVPFYAQNTWTVAPADKTLLKNVEFALRSGTGEPVQSPGLKEPSIYGRALQVEKVTTLTTRVSAGPLKSPKPKKM